MMTKYLTTAVAAMTISWAIALTGPARSEPGCKITIDNPSPGGTIPSDGDVTGKAVLLPPGKYLYLFARRKGLANWWPEGGGPIEVSPASHQWTAVATFGTDADIGRDFEIVAAVVTDNAHTLIQRWFETADRVGKYPPMPFPDIIADCPISRITARKM